MTLLLMKARIDGKGVHLFNRLTGVNVLLDEILMPSILWSSAPRHVSFALTNACEPRCSYCYAPKSRAQLGFGDVKRWLHELDENGTLGVGFGGGEPTLYPNFSKLCRYAASYTEMAVTFTTHAHNLSDNLLTELNGNIHFVRVSVDGLGSTYEQLRGRSFEHLRQRLISLGEIVSFGLNYIINDDTIGQLSDAIDFAKEIGAAEMLLLPEYDPATCQIADPLSFGTLQEFLVNYSKTMPLSISKLSSIGMPICDPLNGQKNIVSYAYRC